MSPLEQEEEGRTSIQRKGCRHREVCRSEGTMGGRESRVKHCINPIRLEVGIN
jgi:hypothetical protein